MMIREKSKCIKHKDESTNARHRGGRIRSSDEVSVMETEQRGSVIYTFEIGQPIMGGTNGQKETITNWSERYLSKNDERVRAFHGCGVEIDGSNMLFSYYEQNKHLLFDRPQCFTHGDYHCDNLMVSNAMEVSVIDWDLFDDNIYGDP